MRIFVKNTGYPSAIIGGDSAPEGYTERTADEYRAIVEAAGPVPVQPVEPPAPSLSDYAAAVQAHLDAVARSRDFDDIVSACSYAAGPNAFQADGLLFLAWRSQVWSYVYAARDAAGSNTVMPTVQQFADMVFAACPKPNFA